MTTLEDILLKVHDLPPLPISVTKVMSLTKDPTTSARELELVIIQDPSLATAVLRRANSAYYGYPKKVASLQEAIVLLGFQTTQEIAIAHAVAPLLKTDLVGYDVKQESLWKHSVLTAIAAEHLCQHKNLPYREVAFTAGLLHDIGKLIISIYVQEVGSYLLDKANETRLPYVEFEEKIIGYSHSTVGGLMIKTWGFPESLIEAISYHHNPKASQKYLDLASIVHVANGLASVLGVGGGLDSFFNPIQQEPLDILNLNKSDIEHLLTELGILLKDHDLFI